MQLAEYAVYGGDPHTRPAAAQAAVQLAPRAPASQLNPPPPHVSSTGGGAGAGDGGAGDGGAGPVVPPPHSQHMDEAVKSESS